MAGAADVSIYRKNTILEQKSESNVPTWVPGVLSSILYTMDRKVGSLKPAHIKPQH